MDGLTSPERDERIKTAKRICWSLGSFWFSRVPFRSKRVLFFCLVFSALLSGLESLVLSASDAKAFDSIILALGRRVLCGRATVKSEDADGKVKHKALKDQAVWKLLGLVPIGTELRVRRLKWLQKALQHKEDNVAFFASLFGFPNFTPASVRSDWEHDDPPLAHSPWVRQIWEDILALHRIDDAINSVESLNDRIGPLLTEKNVQDDF